MNYADKKMHSCGCGLPGNYYSRSVGSGDARPCCNEGCGCDSCRGKEIAEHCCDQRGGFDQSFALAMAYVPLQEWAGIVAPCNGMKNGTVFGELVKPFCGAGRRKG